MTDYVFKADWIDEVPINFRKIKKTVSLNGIWEERIFYEIKENDTKRRLMEDWLTQHYGRAAYTITWWKTHTSVVMCDKIYTHWRLCE